MKLSSTYFRKILGYQIHDYPCIGSRIVPNRQTDREKDRHVKLTVAFRNFVNAAKNKCKKEHTAMLEHLVYVTL